MRVLIYIAFATIIAFGGCKESENEFFVDQMYDFKTVSSGDTVKATFTMKNATDKDLTIEDISSECDCIAPERKTFTLNPGSSDKLNVLFLTVGQIGKQEREVLIRTNGVPRFYKLKIKGDIRK